MTVPVIAIVGYSDSGKTTVASSLIQMLVARGYRVGAVKHCAHGHEVDKPGSDSAKLFEAGAARVVMSSPGMLSSIEATRDDTNLEDIVASFGDSYDLVIAEGFKDGAVPKVVVIREQRLPSSTKNVIATVSDRKTDGKMPWYTFQDMDLLAAQIETQMLGLPKGHQGLVTETASQ